MNRNQLINRLANASGRTAPVSVVFLSGTWSVSRTGGTDHVGRVPERNMVTDHVIREVTEQQQRMVAALRAARMHKGREVERGGEE